MSLSLLISILACVVALVLIISALFVSAGPSNRHNYPWCAMCIAAVIVIVVAIANTPQPI